ncbi:MFS transporter [Paenibacillus sp. FJAT-26967]|uniref:MFS transporter n=1 Tax=Paenibacillus sp. FJAT-26967 TaxID=1729690 RepID=UPI000838E0FA|nr:MFS transporter [Paenibacillus sp. FJAT-26967]
MQQNKTRRRSRFMAWFSGQGSGQTTAASPAAYVESLKPADEPAAASRLDRQTILLLFENTLYGAAHAFSGTFVSIYLWKAKNDFAMIGWFALIHQLSTALTFWLAGKWVKEHNKMNCLRTGVALSAFFYILVLLLGPKSVDYIMLLGMVQGLAAGFFWLAFNIVYFEVTSRETRDRFNGLAGLMGAGVGMLAPWASGLIIVHMSGNIGYKVIFSISLAIFLLGVVVSFFLKKRKIEGTYDWTYGLRCLRSPRNVWRPVCAALVAQGFREGVFGFLIALMVYIATTSEQKLGNFALITSGVSFVSFWFAGRFLKPKFRSRGMLVGVVMVIVVILPFYWKVNYLTLLLFGVGTALFLPLYTIPMTSSVFDLIGMNEESVSRREEFVVLREISINTGRMLGTLLFIIVISRSTAPVVINTLLLLLGSTPLISWFFMRKVLRLKNS